MRHDPTGGLYYRDEALEFFREFGLVAVDPAEPGRPVARAFSVPFAFRDGTEGREELPAGGWDPVIRWAAADRRAGRHPTAVSALEIMVAPRLQRRGISRLMLVAMRDNARRLGFADLYAPLRPTEKHLEPLPPFAGYIARRGSRIFASQVTDRNRGRRPQMEDVGSMMPVDRAAVVFRRCWQG